MYRSRRLFNVIGSAGWIFIVLAAGLHADGKEKKALWKPLADEVYLQEVGRKIPTDKPVTAVVVWKGRLYAVVGGRRLDACPCAGTTTTTIPPGVGNVINESCVVCHGDGRIVDVAVMHKNVLTPIVRGDESIARIRR